MPASARSHVRSPGHRDGTAGVRLRTSGVSLVGLHAADIREQPARPPAIDAWAWGVEDAPPIRPKTWPEGHAATRAAGERPGCGSGARLVELDRRQGDSAGRQELRCSHRLSLIHISEPTRLGMISYAVFCLKKK